MAKKRANNEGSIFKRKNGTWRAQVTIGTTRLSYTSKTQKESREWLRHTLSQIDNGVTFEGANVMLIEYLSNWLVSVKSSLRPNTWSQYQQIVRDHVVPDLGKIKLFDLRPHHIQFLYDKKVSAGVGLRTVQITHAVIRRSLNQAVKLGLIGRNPVNGTTPPKLIRKEMKSYDETQVQRLMITARANGDRNLALYQLAITTGMRQGELLGLKWRDIEWERRSIQIQRQLRPIPHDGFEFLPPKTKAGLRKVVIGIRTAEILREHQERQLNEIKIAGEGWQDLNLVFPTTTGTPMHQTNFYRQFKKLIANTGLPDIRFHDLRHTAASMMLNHGIPILDVSQRLGHAKPSITLDVYGHLIPSFQENAAEVMDKVTIPIEFKVAA